MQEKCNVIREGTVTGIAMISVWKQCCYGNNWCGPYRRRSRKREQACGLYHAVYKIL